MNEKIEVPTMKVPPLKKICMTIGQLPASYVESMSYYEMLVWFVHYLRDDIIPVVNANGEATRELQELYVELQEYVNNYFDNLDVQEEINNKLDEMAESGQLTDIIAQYLGLAGMITFNSVADMKLAENLVNGSKCATLGYYSVNDGGKALYKVRNVTNEDVIDEMTIIALYDNTLVAVLDENDEINIKQLGAYGDGVENDSSSIQTAINKFDNIYIPDGNYLINNDIILKNNIKITGNNNSNILIDGNIGFKLLSDEKSTKIYRLINGTLTAGTYTITSDSIMYYFTINENLSSSDSLILNPEFKTGTVIIGTNYEYEIELTETESSTYTDITSSLNMITQTANINFKHDVEINNINFENINVSNQDKYAITCIGVKDVVIKNCNVKYMGLVLFNITKTDTASTTIDTYVQNGINTNMLNDNLKIINNTITGIKSLYSSISATISGIYLSFCKNSIVENNNIKYLNHGISLWGGNIGSDYMNTIKSQIKFCNNIMVSNNTIYNIKNGGIWSSRASNIKVNNNNVSLCGDVNIDFEGSNNCIADNNNVSDSYNGCLATFYNSQNIVFSNNVCVDNNILSRNRFNLNNGGNSNFIMNVKFIGNKFIARNRSNDIHFQVGPYCIYDYEDNTFTNVRFIYNNQEGPMVKIDGNTFIYTDDIANDENTCLFDIIPSNAGGRSDVIITNNLFKTETQPYISNYVTNNTSFNNKHVIYFHGARFNRKGSLYVKDNVFNGFNKCIELHFVKAAENDNTSALYINLINNILSGSIDNTSVGAKGYYLCCDNKLQTKYGDTRVGGTLENIPSAIPTEQLDDEDNPMGAWFKGTIIHFNQPDANGYTSAICTVEGNPGTWKRFGQIES